MERFCFTFYIVFCCRLDVEFRVFVNVSLNISEINFVLFLRRRFQMARPLVGDYLRI